MIMERFYLTSLILFFHLVSFSQSPRLWLRSDSLATQSEKEIWYDLSGKNNHAELVNFSDISFDTINNNLGLSVKNSMRIEVNDISSVSENITVIVVYQVKDSLDEQNIFQLENLQSSELLIASTQKIYDNNNSLQISESNEITPIIYTHTQKLPKKEDEKYKLTLGNTDSLSFDGTISEILLFDDVSHDSIIKYWESYLAIKYGITLKSRNYYSEKQIDDLSLQNYCDTIWDNDNYASYSGTIIGICNDSTFGLVQRESHSYDEKIKLGLETNPENIFYILLGYDSTQIDISREIEIGEGNIFRMYGLFRVQSQISQEVPDVDSEIKTYLEISAENIEDSILDYQLLIDRSGTANFSPGDIDIYTVNDSDTSYCITNNRLIFRNIKWDTDKNGSDIFSLAKIINDTNDLIVFKSMETEDSVNTPVNEFANMNAAYTYINNYNTDLLTNNNNLSSGTEQSSQYKEKGINRTEEEIIQYSVFPNPTHNNFTVSITSKEKNEVIISILTQEGKIIETRRLCGKENYDEEFSIKNKGEYLINICISNTEVKTFKILIL